jgi:hypothetical protein
MVINGFRLKLLRPQIEGIAGAGGELHNVTGKRFRELSIAD